MEASREGRVLKRIFNLCISVVRAVLLMPVSIVSRVFPKDHSLWVFGSWFGYRYSDNTRYMYEYLLDKDGVRPVWITKDKSLIPQISSRGGLVYYAYSLRGIWCSLRAGKAFYVCGPSDISEYLVFGAQKIMFWHGIPLKRILYDDDLRYPAGLYGKFFYFRDYLLRSVLPDKRQSWDYIVSSSSLVTDRLCSAFSVSSKKILQFGYPRQDILFEGGGGKCADAKVILYAPTHRQEGKGDFSALDFFKDFDFFAMDSYFSERKIKFLINLHFYHDSAPLLEKVKGLSNISICSSGDIYRVLGSVDVLITDYSSIYIDYLFLGRKIVFYSFDYDEYVAVDRGLYEDYFTTVPGPICKSWSEALEAAMCEIGPEDRVRLDSCRDKYFDFKSGGARERIFNYLNNSLA